MKKLNLCLRLQINNLRSKIFVHLSNYTEKVIKTFLLGQGSSIEFSNGNPITKHKRRPIPCTIENEEILGSKGPSLSAIGALMYLGNNTRLDITFSVNLLSRYNNAPTRRHKNEIKHLFSCLRGTTNTWYLSESQKANSQTGYAFTYVGTTISWKSTKQTISYIIISCTTYSFISS